MNEVQLMNAVDSVEGILDWINLNGDISKIDRPLAKEGVSKLLDSLKPVLTLPFNLDDKGIDLLKDAALRVIDNLGTVHAAEVGDVVYTSADVDSYLGGFTGVTDPVREKLRKKPHLLNLLKKKFTEEEQKKIVGNPFLIGLLSIFGPMIIEFIKNWLSKK